MLTGGCLCGAVRYEVDRRRRSPATATAPAASAAPEAQRRARRSVVPGSLRITAGEELLGSWDPPDGCQKVFCSACGGALWATNGELHNPVRMGTFDGDPGIRPSYRQFVAYAAPWEPIPDDGLAHHPERRPAK